MRSVTQLASSMFLVVGVVTADAAAAELPAAVAADLAAAVKTCTDVGGKAVTDAAVKRTDLNGDGREDYVLDIGSIRCEGAASVYGDREKGVTVYAGDGSGGAKNVFSESVFGAKVDGTGTAAKLWLTVMGPQCGKKPAADFASESFCERYLVWNAQAQKLEYAPVSTVKMIE